MSFPVGSKRKALYPIHTSNASSATAAQQVGHDQHPEMGRNHQNISGNMPVGQPMTRGGRAGFNRFPSDAIPNNALGISTQFDTRWVGAPVHTLTETSLEITILNNDNTHVATLCDPSIWFPRIEVLSNGAVSDVVLYDIMFYVDKMTCVSDLDRAKYSLGNIYNPQTFRDVSALTSNYQLHNYDAPTTYNFTIPASGTIVVYAKYRTFLTTAKLFLPALTVEPRLRLYTGNNIQTTTSAAVATVPTLVSVQTYLRGIIYNSDILENLTIKYRNRRSITRCHVYERQTFSLPITSNTQTTDQLLTGLTGRYAWLLVIDSQAAPTQNQIYSDYAAADMTNGTFWKKFKDITLLDSNQRPWNFTNIPELYLNAEVWGDHWRSAMPFEKEINLIPFSQNCQLTRETGIDLGTMYLDGNWTLRFTPISVTGNTITAGMTTTLIVLGARVCYFTQTIGGGVEFQRSN